jgi:hypothetical protein
MSTTRKRKIDSVSNAMNSANKRAKTLARFKHFEDISFNFQNSTQDKIAKNLPELLRKKIWESEKECRILWGWGCNASGQLGLGNKEVHDKPERLRLPRDIRVKKVVSGNTFIVLLTYDGRLFCCGWCPGARKYIYNRRISVLNGLPAIHDVVAGRAHLLALAENGNVYEWIKGEDDLPRRIPELSQANIRAISCGQEASFAIDENGGVLAWGPNTSGQLGVGDMEPRLVPTRIPNLTAVISIDGGDFHTLALTQQGVVYAFGSNSNGQLGIGDMKIPLIAHPTIVEKLSHMKIISISCGDCSSLALTSDGVVYGWGKNLEGQLGKPGDDYSFPKIVKLPDKKRVLSVVSGYKHSLALMEDGSVWSWGQSRIGQLGRDEGSKSWEITELKNCDVTAVFAGAYLSFALCK